MGERNEDGIGMEMKVKMKSEEWEMRMKLWMKVKGKCVWNETDEKTTVKLMHMYWHIVVQKNKQLTHPPSPPHNHT